MSEQQANPKFVKYHTKALLKRKVPYFLNYIRVVGMRKRGGGKTYLEFLPPKLLPPGSTPPPISEKELVGSRILHRAKPRSTVFHHDGAWSYDRVIKDKFKKLRSRSVVHANMEFVRPIRSVRLPGGRSSSSRARRPSTRRGRRSTAAFRASSRPRPTTTSTRDWWSTSGLGCTG